jgi:hypothetical protein
MGGITQELTKAEAVALYQIGPVPLWWFWLGVAIIELAGIAWILAHLGPGGGARPPR